MEQAPVTLPRVHTVAEPLQGEAVVIVNRNGSTLTERVPATAVPTTSGIEAGESEVMIGQRWVRLVGLAAGLGGLGVGIFGWLSPEWTSFLQDPETVSIVVAVAGTITWAANETLGRYIRKGRINNGVAPSRIVDP
jgi:hypothetical protein